MHENKKYFPIRFAVLFTLSLFIAILTVTFWLVFLRTPGFRIAIYAVKLVLAFKVINSPHSADLKAYWVFALLAFPIAAIPIYLVFYRPYPSKKELLAKAKSENQRPKNDSFYSSLALFDNGAFSFSREIMRAAGTSAYSDAGADYLSSPAEKRKRLLCDLKNAKKFIFLEFYTVAAGSFWGEIFDILKEKTLHGVEVRVIYDELGSLRRLPNDFCRQMKKYGINAVCHKGRRGFFIGGMNSRNHRKIAVIDGKIAYTGGINLADEYLYPTKKLGAWKDSAVRLTGNIANEFTFLFLSDFVSAADKSESFFKYYRYERQKESGAVIAFGNGPSPLYEANTASLAICSMISNAKKEVFITTPYLICGSEVECAIRDASKRGVKIRIVIPSRPDRYAAYLLTKTCAKRLCRLGAEIYEYSPGFLHAKTYLADGKYAAVGSINLDYRSLGHNLENGVWFEGHKVIEEIENDAKEILSVSQKIDIGKKGSVFESISRALIEILAPLF